MIWNKCVILSDWCYYDQLDGKTLQNGEKLKIKWPDSSITEETVLTKCRNLLFNDHGGRTEIPIIEAYITIHFRGVKAEIRLVDSGLLCQRV